MNNKIRIATTSLAGCFGCHMSLLDIDEKIIPLLELVEFNRTPITDIKQLSDVDVGLIEGGTCNTENIHTLREFRRHCKTLVAVGACALNGGLPALRNTIPVEECLATSYLNMDGLKNPQIPNDPELPLLLSQVHPIHEIVKVDYSLPGCPPSADLIWQFLSDLLAGRSPQIHSSMIHYD
ncbi:MAG: NADP oxidoreductase [Gammaproteobacteria bacterium]|nr:NADP oxidoreductase [Gammaproteobacteria bacterium]